MQDISFSTRKLRYSVKNDVANPLDRNWQIVCDFAESVKVGDWRKMTSLCDRQCHSESFWGTVRGPVAMAVVAQQEKEKLYLRWCYPDVKKSLIPSSSNDHGFFPLTSCTFMRHGKVQYKEALGSYVVYLPVVAEVWAKLMQRRVAEYLVISPSGLIVFRAVSYSWTLGRVT